MIFVTVGTTSFPFTRLFRAVDAALQIMHSREKLIVQRGKSSYCFHYPHAQTRPELPFKEFISCLKRARVVVCHGGAGTALLTLRYTTRKPFVIPRLKRLGEHTDDHQVFFAHYLKKKGLVETCSPTQIQNQELITDIIHYLEYPQALPQKRLFTNSVLIKNLMAFSKNVTIVT